MKNIFESPETFEAYATIDAGIFMLTDLLANTDEVPYEELKDRMIVIYKSIIESKKLIEADYSLEETMLNSIQKL